MATWKRYIGVLALGLVLVGICSIGMAQTSDSVNFGSVPVGQTGTATYTFKILEASETSATVKILPPSTPFGLQDAPSGSFTLAPGQSITFTVTFTPAAAGDYTGSFTITAQGGYPVEEKTTTVYLTGHGGSGGETPPPTEAPPTTGITIPFPLLPPTAQAPTGAVPGTTDDKGKFKVSLSPTTTVAGHLTLCDSGKPLANQPFQLAKTDAGYEVAAPGYSIVTAPVASKMTFMGLSSVDLGVICLTQAEKEPIPCDCARLPVNKECEEFSIQYYIEIPKGCSPTTMSLVDSTSGAALWDRIVWSEEEFNSLSTSGQRDVLANRSIVGVESNRVYEYQGSGLASNTRITIAQREGNPNKWIFELSSCCHTIPTLKIGLRCPGKRFTVLKIGLTFDAHNQYQVLGQVLVGNSMKKLTLDNYNSFFDDCNVSYCDANDRSDPNSLGSNGRILLQMAPSSSCKFDLAAFRKELYERLKTSGCHCEIPELDNRDGSLRGWIYTNRCTPQVVTCIRDVLSHYTDCKEVYWIGRQIDIRTKR